MKQSLFYVTVSDASRSTQSAGILNDVAF